MDTKLGLSGYNADDEKNITDILNQIMNSKFNKFYRNLATNWFYEISRPSRRFRKLTLQDLEVNTVNERKIPNPSAKQMADKGFYRYF